MSRGDARAVRAEGEAAPLIGGEVGASGELRVNPLATRQGRNREAGLGPRRVLPRSLSRRRHGRDGGQGGELYGHKQEVGEMPPGCSMPRNAVGLRGRGRCRSRRR